MTINKIKLFGDVDQDMLSKVQKAILNRSSNAPLYFILNSGGGDVTSGLAIINLLERHKGKVTIEVLGEAESMAAIVLQAADLRLMNKYSHLMIHSGEIEPPSGKEKDIEAWIKLSKVQDQICDELILRKIQKKKPDYSWMKFKQEIANDNYFSAKQALEWNLVDKII
jgi:ATP-dependent Clp protease protease subunit